MERQCVEHQQDDRYNYGIAARHCERKGECIVGVHATRGMYGRRKGACLEETGFAEHIPANEKVVLAGDMNGHIGEDRSGVERWHGVNGYGSQNEEGRTILQCAQMYDSAITNTFFDSKQI